MATEGMMGSYKFKTLAVVAALLLVPMLGVLGLAFAGKASVSDFVELAKWAMGFLSANGAAAIIGRAWEGAAGKRGPAQVTAGGDVVGPLSAQVTSAAVSPLAPLGLLVLGLAFGACSPQANRDAAKTALDVVSVACIIANAESQDATVQQVCGIADVLVPDMQRIIGEQRTAARRYAAARMAAARCADGGAP
jgi:hypothetical protein